jgi:hypothetical protein
MACDHHAPADAGNMIKITAPIIADFTAASFRGHRLSF